MAEEYPLYKECELIDARKVNAYLELTIDPANPTELVLESSWDTTKIDLSNIISASETQTTLKLSPATTPTYLEYDGESGVPQCIYGEDLARIIPMQKLKDVSTAAVSNGYVYMFSSSTSLFEPYDLLSHVNTTNSRLSTLETDITTLRSTVSALQNTVSTLQSALTALTARVAALEAILTKPSGIPSDAVVAWGNVNLYSDSTNSNNRNSGFYTHSTATNKTNDEYFA